jgi:S1-C subfamily serine protease
MDAPTLARVKGGTAFLTVPQTEASGSAFRISKDGLYVTCAHVLGRLKKGDQVTLTLNPGLANERKSQATILKLTDEFDLAVVKAEETDQDFLPLADAGGIKETDAVVVVGFPLGEALAMGGKAPEVTLKTGRVTSLRRAAEGRLEALQIDAELLPGNSGGPVLDSRGRVVGIAAARTAANSLNFAVPVESLRIVLNAPSITVMEPLVIPAGASDQPISIAFTVSWLNPAGPAEKVSGAIASSQPGGAEHPLEVRALGAGRFEIQFVPGKFLSEARSSLLRADFIQEVGNQRFTTAFDIRDAAITVGDRKLLLSDVCRVFPRAGRVILNDGTKLEGPVSGMDRLVQVLTDGEGLFNGANRDAVVIRPRCGRPPTLPLLIRAAGRGVTNTWSGRIRFEEAPAERRASGGTYLYPPPTGPADNGDPVSIDLGGRADKLAFGGGGRFAVARVPGNIALSVVDCVAGKTMGTIPLASKTQPFTATADAVLLGCGNRVERWTLEPLAKVGLSEPWLVGEILCLSSGAADADRLNVLYDAFGKSGVIYLEQRDTATGRLLAMSNSGSLLPPECDLLTSTTGDMLTTRCASSREVLVVRAGQLEKITPHGILRAEPGDDGWVFGGNAPWSLKGGSSPFPGSKDLLCRSSTLPGLGWSIPPAPDGFRNKRTPPCSLIDLARGSVLLKDWVELPEVLPPADARMADSRSSGIPWADRFMLSPQLGILVTVPWDCSHLTIRRVDPVGAMTAAGARFSLMSCPATVRLPAGEGVHRLRIGLLSHAGTRASAQLAIPVPGISLADDGTLEISAAARAAGQMLHAVIRVTGPDGFENLHRLSIQP